VSTYGGVDPQWSADGETLFFEWGNKLWQVEVTRGGSALSLGPPELLLDGAAVDLQVWNGYHVVPERGGVLTIRRVEDEEVAEPKRGIHVVENWVGAFGGEN
jgi:hypothetical protein